MSSESWFLVHRLLSSPCVLTLQKRWGGSLGSFPVPLGRASPSWPNLIPKTTPPNTTILGYAEFGAGANIQSVVSSLNQIILFWNFMSTCYPSAAINCSVNVFSLKFWNIVLKEEQIWWFRVASNIKRKLAQGKREPRTGWESSFISNKSLWTVFEKDGSSCLVSSPVLIFPPSSISSFHLFSCSVSSFLVSPHLFNWLSLSIYL